MMWGLDVSADPWAGHPWLNKTRVGVPRAFCGVHGGLECHCHQNTNASHRSFCRTHFPCHLLQGSFLDPHSQMCSLLTLPLCPPCDFLCTVKTVVKSQDSDTLELLLMVEITSLGAVIGRESNQDAWEDLSPVHSFHTLYILPHFLLFESHLNPSSLQAHLQRGSS